MKTAAIILAAGASRRLGFPKQLVKLDGISLVRKTAIALVDAGVDKIGVVTGAWHRELERELTGLDIELIYNKCWRDSVSTSIECGASWVDSLKDCGRTLFLSTDQWKLDSSDIVMLLNEHDSEQASVVAASYGGRLGTPVLIGCSDVLSKMKVMGEHKSFVSFLENQDSAVHAVPMENASMDLDTPAQLIELSQYFDVTVLRPESLGAL